MGEETGLEIPHAARVCGLPYRPSNKVEFKPNEQAIRRVIFFGRLETRKGFTLFTQAVLELWSRYPAIAQTIEEVVLLGREDEPGSAQKVKSQLAKTGLRVVHAGNLDSEEAIRYLREHTAGAVAVIPSAYENFPY